MSRPQAYFPEQGYKYQILVKCPTERAFEHCDHAKDRQEKNFLVAEYQLAYGAGYQFKTILLPSKYWN